MRTTNILAALICCAALTVPAAAVDPVYKCQTAKLKLAGKYNFCRLKAKAKEVKTLLPADYTKCDDKYDPKWLSAEADAGPGVCPTEGDETAIKDAVTADADRIALKLTGERFVDNGDGTVTDLQTGLMWEQSEAGFSIHGNQNTYTWTDDTNLYPNDPDGTAFALFLFALNYGSSADGATVSGCFAGYCDWRLPTVAELQTILIEPYPCSTSPCIDPIFGPTAAAAYWSSTFHPSVLYNAWGVSFADGSVSYQAMDSSLHARAVRNDW